MKVRDGLEVDDERLAEICRRYGVAELSLFGSALGDDFGPDSDIDLLYLFEPDARIGWEIVDLQAELTALLGRTVDLVPKRYVHWHLRERVLAEARQLYAA